ncbi:MAG TPA: hypothetical protein VL096_04615 [Pirellulaceae bacterium]|nr:hypothetical protein [Pirellulaceae bacterium]
MLKFVVTLCSLGCLASIAIAQDQARPQPPAPLAVANAKKQVAEVYRNDYLQAKTPEQRQALVAKMLTDARRMNEDLTGKYALLVVARDMASTAGDWAGSIAAVEQLAATFDLDPYQLADEVRAKLDQAEPPPRTAKAACALALSLANAAISQDRHEIAERLLASALKLARVAGDAALIKQITQRAGELPPLQAQFQEVQVALTMLDSKPTDPAANLTVGKYRCLVQGRWDDGVPMLALGSDAALAKPAELELHDPSDANELLAIADAWWDVAGLAQEHQRMLRRHAVDRYLLALPRLDGLAKKKAETRLESVEQWLSKEATYRVTSFDKAEPPLPSLLTAGDKLYGQPPKQYAFKADRSDAYIVIDLQRDLPISRIELENRSKEDRMSGVQILATGTHDQRGEVVWHAPQHFESATIRLPRLMLVRYITIGRDPQAKNDRAGDLALRKVKLFGPE